MRKGKVRTLRDWSGGDQDLDVRLQRGGDVEGCSNDEGRGEDGEEDEEDGVHIEVKVWFFTCDEIC